MVKKKGSVPRPVKTSEFVIQLATIGAEGGWRDICATQKNAVADAWDRLTKTPLQSDTKCHQLKGELATFDRAGIKHARWQYELTGGARIWFYVDGRTVNIVEVFTHHPNQTK